MRDTRVEMEGASFTFDDVEVSERKELYQGFFKIERVSLRHRLFAGGWSPLISRELFIRGMAVAGVIYDPRHKLIGLVEQFRIGRLDTQVEGETPWCYEVVAGMAEDDEIPEEVISRELKEEAGIVSDQIISICDYYSSPGGTDEKLALFCLLADLVGKGGLYGLAEEGEDIRFHVLPEQDVFDNLYKGRYNNAATLICLQWLYMHKELLSLDND